MANIVEISDWSLPELDVFARLTEAQLRSRQDAEKGRFIAESAKVIGYALDAGCEPLALLMEPCKLEGARELIARCGAVTVYTGERAVLEKLTGYALTRGVLCAMRRPRAADARVVCAGARRVAVLEDITDAANVGAIFRSAAALGMDALLLTPGCCDPLCRRAVRVSMGAVFQIPWARIGEQYGDWPAAGLAQLRAAGFQTAALALNPQSVAIDDGALARADRLALILGTEGSGLRRETVDNCDYVARIPMAHGVNSLNVAAAAAVAFWQLGVR